MQALVKADIKKIRMYTLNVMRNVPFGIGEISDQVGVARQTLAGYLNTESTKEDDARHKPATTRKIKAWLFEMTRKYGNDICE